MAKYKTLELHPVKLDTIRLAPGNYRHSITLHDWDDGEEVTFTINLSYPINAITPLKIRVLIEDLLESPPST
ncbi:hypothetical protein ES705_33239 [subsurface metagenome]